MRSTDAPILPTSQLVGAFCNTKIADSSYGNAVWAVLAEPHLPSQGSMLFEAISSGGWASKPASPLISLSYRTLFGGTGVLTSETVKYLNSSTDSPSATIKHLIHDLDRCFEEEPIEDGMEHPAERVLLDLARGSGVAAILASRLREGSYRHRAALLRCVGRLPVGLAGEWGIPLAAAMLEDRDIEIRDAAIRALELWGAPAATDALRVHSEKEPVKWLADYVRLVVGVSH